MPVPVRFPRLAEVRHEVREHWAGTTVQAFAVVTYVVAYRLLVFLAVVAVWDRSGWQPDAKRRAGDIWFFTTMPAFVVAVLAEGIGAIQRRGDWAFRWAWLVGLKYAMPRRASRSVADLQREIFRPVGDEGDGQGRRYF